MANLRTEIGPHRYASCANRGGAAAFPRSIGATNPQLTFH
jgi:hypothetical protein